MKIYISFGQAHAHSVNGVTFDKDCLAEIVCESYAHGRGIAFELFGEVFCTSYAESELDGVLKYFPRGVLKAN
jgi:hypothetical protein